MEELGKTTENILFFFFFFFFLFHTFSYVTTRREWKA